jgi:acyl carrier protein
MVLLERYYQIKVEDPREGRKILQSVQSMADFIQSKQPA